MGREDRIQLHARPSGVRLCEAGLDAVSARVIEERTLAAREQGREEERFEHAALLDEAAERLDAARERAEAELAPFACELALAIASEILRMEVDAGRYDLERIVRETLADSGVGRGNCVVHLNPKDRETLEGVPFRSGTVLEADPEVAPGEVHVTTPQGLLVRELPALLEAISLEIQEGLA
jgi:flagellar biosynthesis/type III secretory pathway protein FliH